MGCESIAKAAEGSGNVTLTGVATMSSVLVVLWAVCDGWESRSETRRRAEGRCAVSRRFLVECGIGNADCSKRHAPIRWLDVRWTGWLLVGTVAAVCW